MVQLLVTGLVVLANLWLAIIVFQKNPYSATHRLIAALAIILSLWSLTNFIALSPQDDISRLWWVRTVMLVTSPFGAIVFFLATVFPGKEFTLSKLTTVGVGLLVAAAAALSTTPLVFIDLISFGNGNFTLIPGVGIIAFAVNLVVLTTWGLLRFIKKMLHSQGAARQQIAVVVVGMVISFSLLILTNFLAVVLFQSVQLTFLGPPLTLIMVATMTYAVLRHRFLDIRVTIVRSVGFSLVLLLSALAYSGILFTLIRFLLQEELSVKATIISTLIVVPVLFSFDGFKQQIQQLTERIFFKYDYELEPIVEELADFMTSTLEVQVLISHLSNFLQEHLKITGLLIGLLQEDTLKIYSAQNDTDTKQNKDDLLKLSTIASANEDNLIWIDDLEEGEVKQLLRHLNLEVVIALESKNELIGTLFLSSKHSGESYTPRDLRLLRIISPQLSVAIQNAQSYQQISHFNIKLKREVKEATHELQTANTRLQELDKLKDQFVSLASHELRTPLTAIKSYIWMALSGQGGKLTDKQSFYLDRASTATDRLIKLVNDMLNISRIEAGRIGLEVKEVDMLVLCRDSIEEVKPRASELGLKLEFLPLPDDKAFLVAADPDKIKEVIINLMGNSMKFTPKGGTICLSLEHDGQMIVCHVEDTGVGISQENIQHLFQKFDLMKDSYQTNQDISQGTGLGLYICKSIIELHHGTIWAESDGKGKGSRFSFTLLKASAAHIAKLQAESDQVNNKADIIHNTV